MIKKINATFPPNEVRAAAEEYLGPAVDITSIIDNHEAPPYYGDFQVSDAWRVYYTMLPEKISCVGGDIRYLLIEKKTHRILGEGVESSE